MLRHAKARLASAGQLDRDRPLSGSGSGQADALGRLLADVAARARAGLPVSGPELVMCSTARRTVETADRVVLGLGTMPEIRYLDLLYGARPSDVVDVLGSVDDAVLSVLVVGHNPTAATLAAGTPAAGAVPAVPFPPAALSVLDLGASSWSDLDRRRFRIIAQVRPPYPEAPPDGAGPLP